MVLRSSRRSTSRELQRVRPGEGHALDRRPGLFPGFYLIILCFKPLESVGQFRACVFLVGKPARRVVRMARCSGRRATGRHLPDRNRHRESVRRRPICYTRRRRSDEAGPVSFAPRFVTVEEHFAGQC
jgi:hypothetical protein